MKIRLASSTFVPLIILIAVGVTPGNVILSKFFDKKELGFFHVGYNRLKGDEFNFRWSIASYTYSNNYLGLELPTFLVSSYNQSDGRDNYVSDNYLIAASGVSTMAFFRIADKLMGTEAMYLMGDFLGTVALATTALPNARLHLKYMDFPLSFYGGLNTQIFLEERTRFLYVIPKMADVLITQETGIQYRLWNLKLKAYIGRRLYNMTDLEIPSSYIGAEVYTFIDWYAFLSR